MSHFGRKIGFLDEGGLVKKRPAADLGILPLFLWCSLGVEILLQILRPEAFCTEART